MTEQGSIEQVQKLDQWIRQLDLDGGTVNQQQVWRLATARMRALRVPPEEQQRWRRRLADALWSQPDIPASLNELQQHPQREAYGVLVVSQVSLVGCFEDSIAKLRPRQPALLRYQTVVEHWRKSWQAHPQPWLAELIHVLAWWRVSAPPAPGADA